MKQLKKGKKLRCNIAVRNPDDRATTARGAQTGAFAVQPEYAIAVDVTHGRTPGWPLGSACSTSAAAPPSAWAPTCIAADKGAHPDRQGQRHRLFARDHGGRHRHERLDDADRRTRHRVRAAVHSAEIHAHAGRGRLACRRRRWSRTSWRRSCANLTARAKDLSELMKELCAWPGPCCRRRWRAVRVERVKPFATICTMHRQRDGFRKGRGALIDSLVVHTWTRLA